MLDNYERIFPSFLLRVYMYVYIMMTRSSFFHFFTCQYYSVGAPLYVGCLLYRYSCS